MNILVTGGAGFIGSHLIEKLVNEGHSITVITSKPNPVNLINVQNRIKIISCDYLNNPSWSLLLKDIDIVYHLLWTSLPRNNFHLAVKDIETNVINSLKILDACVENKVRKIIFTSSGGTVYGITGNIQIKEDFIMHPISNYGLTKLMFEKYLELYSYQYGLNYTILRISNAYGERQDPAKGQGVISTWIDKIIKNKKIELWGDGSVIRDYIYVEDVADALVLTGNLTQENKIYNVGSGIGLSLNDLLFKIKTIIGITPEVVYYNKHSSDVPFNILNNSLIKKEFNWYPKISIEQGIMATFNYLKQIK